MALDKNVKYVDNNKTRKQYLNRLQTKNTIFYYKRLTFYITKYL